MVDKTAEMNGYHIVFAYPDAVTPEELKSPYIKELKLKPPAAQPFYVAPHVDMTGGGGPDAQHLVPAAGREGPAVDVSKLDVPTPPPGGLAPPAPWPGPAPTGRRPAEVTASNV